MAHKTNLQAVAATISRPFSHALVARVDNYHGYLSRFEGSYVYHQHSLDEWYLVLEGEAWIDFPNAESVHLGPHDGLIVRAGEVHRSRSETGALVLMVKAKDLPAGIASPADLTEIEG